MVAPWQDTTTIVCRGKAHDYVAELKDRPGRDILVFGSRTLWNDLLTAGLVDELRGIVGAVVLGAGTPAFAATPTAPLRLLSTHSWDDSHNGLIRYAAPTDVHPS